MHIFFLDSKPKKELLDLELISSFLFICFICISVQQIFTFGTQHLPEQVQRVLKCANHSLTRENSICMQDTKGTPCCTDKPTPLITLERLSKSFEQSLKITAAAELVKTLKKKTVQAPEQERKNEAMMIIRARWR